MSKSLNATVAFWQYVAVGNKLRANFQEKNFRYGWRRTLRWGWRWIPNEGGWYLPMRLCRKTQVEHSLRVLVSLCPPFSQIPIRMTMWVPLFKCFFNPPLLSTTSTESLKPSNVNSNLCKSLVTSPQITETVASRCLLVELAWVASRNLKLLFFFHLSTHWRACHLTLVAHWKAYDVALEVAGLGFRVTTLWSVLIRQQSGHRETLYSVTGEYFLFVATLWTMVLHGKWYTYYTAWSWILKI